MYSEVVMTLKVIDECPSSEDSTKFFALFLKISKEYR